MVPMARILVVGVVFIAAPCPFAELKPTKQLISANAAAETNFMYLPSVRRSGDRVNPLGEHRLQGSRISLEALRRDLGRLAGKDLFEAGIQRVQRRKATLIASSSPM